MGPIWGRQDPGGPHIGPMKPYCTYRCSYRMFSMRLFPTDDPERCNYSSSSFASCHLPSSTSSPDAYHQAWWTATSGGCFNIDKMSYRKISQPLICVLKVIWLFWNLTGVLAARLPIRLSNFKAIRLLQYLISCVEPSRNLAIRILIWYCNRPQVDPVLNQTHHEFIIFSISAPRNDTLKIVSTCSGFTKNLWSRLPNIKQSTKSR